MEKVNLRVAALSINTTTGDFVGNARKIRDGIKKAQAKRATVAVFPELCLCGYNPRDLLRDPGFVKAQLAELDKLVLQTKDIVVIVGFIEEEQGRLFNSAAVISNGCILGIARKQYLINNGFLNESRYFTSGEQKACFKVAGVPIEVMVGEDFVKQDSLASLICVSGNFPFYRDDLNQTPCQLAVCAQEKQKPIIFANLVGGNDEVVFSGESAAYQKDGKVISRSMAWVEAMVLADLLLPTQPNFEAPVAQEGLSIMTMDYVNLVAPMEENDNRLLQALVLGVKDFVGKCGYNQVLVGLSGGVDSSLVAGLAVLALGAQGVKGVLLPSRFSSQTGIDDALYLAKHLNIEYDMVSIEPIFQAYEQIMPLEFGQKGIPQQNLQARIRATMLMGLSNAHSSLLLLTCNKSEVFAGYGTLYGDLAGALAPIKDLTKAQIYSLCRILNRVLGTEVVNESILTKAPSAELDQNQKDCDFLPPYEHLDVWVECCSSFSDFEGKEQSEKWRRNFLQNEYKLRQIPLGLAVTPFSLNQNRSVPVAKKLC